MSQKKNVRTTHISALTLILVTVIFAGTILYLTAISSFYSGSTEKKTDHNQSYDSITTEFMVKNVSKSQEVEHPATTVSPPKIVIYNVINVSTNTTASDLSVAWQSCVVQPLILITLASIAITATFLIICLVTCIGLRFKNTTLNHTNNNSAFTPHSWWQSEEGTPRIGYKSLTNRNVDYDTICFNDTTQLTYNDKNTSNKGNTCNYHDHFSSDDDSSSSNSSPTRVPPNSARL